MDKNPEQPKSTAELADCNPVTEDAIDAALEGSFPASDPIPWTLGTVPCPDPESDPDPSPEAEEE